MSELTKDMIHSAHGNDFGLSNLEYFAAAALSLMPYSRYSDEEIAEFAFDIAEKMVIESETRHSKIINQEQ